MSLSRRSATLLISAGLVGLLAASAWDRDGLRKHRRLEAQVRRVAAENLDVEVEVARLRRQVRALQGDPAALERAAREELGFVRPGEIVYRLQGEEAGRR